MTYLDVLLGGVATWRITHLLLYENGPFRVIRKLRERFGVVYVDDDSTEISSYKYEITMCTWCTSVWVGLVTTVLLRLSPQARWLLLPFVTSASSAIIERAMARLKPSQPSFPELRIN